MCNKSDPPKHDYSKGKTLNELFQDIAIISEQLKHHGIKELIIKTNVDDNHA